MHTSTEILLSKQDSIYTIQVYLVWVLQGNRISIMEEKVKEVREGKGAGWGLKLMISKN